MGVPSSLVAGPGMIKAKAYSLLLEYKGQIELDDCRLVSLCNGDILLSEHFAISKNWLALIGAVSPQVERFFKMLKQAKCNGSRL